jgi:excisionase family DNA binding protein
MTSNMRRNFSLQEAASALGISVHTLRAWKRQGRLGYLQMGRRILIPEAEVTKLLQNNYMPPRNDLVPHRRSHSKVDD